MCFGGDGREDNVTYLVMEHGDFNEFNSGDTARLGESVLDFGKRLKVAVENGKRRGGL